MLGHRPQAFSLIGVQPVELADYGGSLTAAVRDQVPKALEIGLAELATWGIVPTARQHQHGTAVVSDAIAQGRYETERPAENVAWRKGDERFMALRAAAERTDDDGESR